MTRYCTRLMCLLGILLCSHATAATTLPERYLSLEDSRRIVRGDFSGVHITTLEDVKKQIRRHADWKMRINPAVAPEFFQALKALRHAETPTDRMQRGHLLGRAGYFLQEKDIPDLIVYVQSIPNPNPRAAGCFSQAIVVAAMRGMPIGQIKLTEISRYAFWAALPATLSRQERVALYRKALKVMSFSPNFPSLRKNVVLAEFSEAEQKAIEKTLAIADEMHVNYMKSYGFLHEALPEWHKKRNLSGETPWLADVNAPSVLPGTGTDKASQPLAPTADPQRDTPSQQTVQPRAANTPAQTEAIVKEGVSAFKQILETLEANRYPLLIQQVLDNGKPISKAKKEQGFDEFRRAIQTEKALLAEVKAKGMLSPDQYRDFHVEAQPDGQPGQPARDANAPTGGSGDITLLFRIPGTAEVFKKHIPRVGGASAEKTITANGDLQVYMRRIDGKWYWNPFGW